MRILSSKLYQDQLKSILAPVLEHNPQNAKNFKLYLDTIIINMPSKAKKYKRSVYFDDDNIKDIEHQGYTIPFYMDEANSTYVILGIVEAR
jgi:hypothetical protein